jgi:hypothetical protein
LRPSHEWLRLLPKLTKHPHHAAEAAAFGAVDAPPFVRVGHNGHWVTATWGC